MSCEGMESMGKHGRQGKTHTFISNMRVLRSSRVVWKRFFHFPSCEMIRTTWAAHVPRREGDSMARAAGSQSHRVTDGQPS